MEYTKGNWKVITNGNNLLAIASCYEDVTKNRNICSFEPLFLRGEKSNLYRQLGGEDEANANLIVTAVNACQELNPDNPLAVAEGVKDVCGALLGLMEALERCGSEHNDVRVAYNLAKPAIAKVKESK